MNISVSDGRYTVQGGSFQQQQFLQRVRNHREINELLHKQKDNSNKTSSNEELFAEIEKSRFTQNQTNSSGESKEARPPMRSKTVDKQLDRAIHLFGNSRVIFDLPAQNQEEIEGNPMIMEINQVFKENSLMGTPDHKGQLQQKQYGSYLSTEISNEPDLQKVSSRLSLLTSGSEQQHQQKQQQQQQQQQPYYYEEEQNSFYEDNHRRKRKTISDEDSHFFMVRLDRVLIQVNQLQFDKRTTVMIKNIPNKYTIQLLRDLIDKNHSNSYDFLYLPIDFKNKCNMGYAFINFVDTQVIVRFFNEFQSKRWPHYNSEKICQLRYARIQGRQALIQHFQFSSVMNQKDKKLKPVIVPQNELSRIQQLIKNQKQSQ